ncbi:uncharacterized protein LOC122658762 [Telopea speciosissima]|uniref:uncharacterized protein LOC122658762 n=1 Tax=Telopea speciosissima TaxID=54955 RepID=UPI001CC6DA15|nr:uncharacterized protein LOC122658762 [Telopea speciosissima]
MTWLIFSMKPEIGRRFMRKETAKDIWGSISTTFDRVGGLAKVYQLLQKVITMKQGDRTISEYYNTAIGLWEEYDHYRDLQLSNSEDEAKAYRTLEKERALILLGGLNPKYEPIRIQLLGRSPLPSFDEVCSYLQSEETRRVTMELVSSLERSALSSSSHRDWHGGD